MAVTLLDFERSGIDYSANARRLLDDVREYATETKRNGQAIMDVPWVRSLMADRYIECEVARLIAYNVAYMQGQGLVPHVKRVGDDNESGNIEQDARPEAQVVDLLAAFPVDGYVSLTHGWPGMVAGSGNRALGGLAGRFVIGWIKVPIRIAHHEDQQEQNRGEKQPGELVDLAM